MNMALVLMAKAFKLNYSTPTNNNQRISSNPRNRQIAQPGMNIGQNRQMHIGGNGGNQFRQYAGQNVGNQHGYNAGQNVGNQNLNGNEDWVILLGTAQSDQGEGMLLIFRLTDLDEIEEVNANCILMANLQQASTSGTQTDKAPVYDSDGSAEFVYQEQCLTKKINALHLSSSKQITALNEELSNLNKQLSKEKSTVSSLLEEKKRLKSDFKIPKDELLAKQALELEIERLLRAVVSQDIMSIVQNNSFVDTLNLQTELDRTKERFENCIIKKENEYAKL
ncbi:hypothetical protein Tco_0878854 [Tanacetum coccineum]|uniref:Uncharacterized protein n=1 Tax=Tanacetum coccineum TaxID=301880 RepID=A0ABQ5C2H4_9ASTR